MRISDDESISPPNSENAWSASPDGRRELFQVQNLPPGAPILESDRLGRTRGFQLVESLCCLHKTGADIASAPRWLCREPVALPGQMKRHRAPDKFRSNLVLEKEDEFP